MFIQLSFKTASDAGVMIEIDNLFHLDIARL